MMFVEIDGTLDELRGLHDVKGLQLQGGAHDLGGGRFRGVGIILEQSALDEVRARGLAVQITMDEAEVQRRYQEKQRMMAPVMRDAGLLEDRYPQAPADPKQDKDPKD